MLTLLLYATFFYLMMRFGCGAHMVHGHAHHYLGREGGGPQGTPGQDPVCKMAVAAGEGYTKSYEGRIVHFCSRECLDKFEAEPYRYYVAQKGEPG